MRRVRSVLFSAVFVVAAASASAQSSGQTAPATPAPTSPKTSHPSFTRAASAATGPLTRKDIDFGPGGSEGGAKLLSYVPGRGYERYGKGAGKRIPGGGNTYINFYMH